MSRAPMISRVALAVSASLALPTLFACIQHPLKPVVLKQEAEEERQIDLIVNRDVDVLFVIDNSGSMGEEQGGLSKAFPEFIKVLDRVKANYHIGVTTSDMYHSSCSGIDGLEGHLRMELCTERENEFYFEGTDTYRFNNACKSVCPITADGQSEDDYELLPTKTLEDADEKVRPWIQSIEGQTNIANASAEDALACYGPQGINGCGFESQLEAMTRALDYSKKQDEPEYGFLRDRAILAVVHVTDELDCSSNPSFQAEVWDDETTTFWSEGAASPNSSICWHAGVKCSGSDGGRYEECEPANFAPNGDEISESEADEHKSVLLSLNRYIGQLDKIEQNKKDLDINQELVFAVIGGVNSMGEARYPIGKDAPDGSADRQSYINFGIGVGCSERVAVLEEEDMLGNPIPAEIITQEAVPPVRLKKIAEHFGDDENQSMFSVCDPDQYGTALEVIAKKIEEQIRPACYRRCPENQDPDAELFVPKCIVTETSKEHGTVVLNECAHEGKGDDKVYLWEDDNYVIEEDDENSCYAMLVDKDGSSESPHDDLSQECLDENRVLEFKVARRPGVTMPADLTTQANCSLSSFKDIDCPEPEDD